MKIDKNLKDLIFNFFENEEDPIFIFKITANREEFYYANPSFYNILGYTEKDVKYLKFNEIYNNVENKLKSNFIDNIKKNKSIVISTFLIKKDGSTFPALIKFYLYKQDNENFLMAFCKNQIEKSIIEYRKYISDFLLRNFQKDNIETDLILKVAESIFVFFKSNGLFYYPIEIQNDNARLYTMNNSALMVTSEEQELEHFIELIENNINLIKIRKQPLVVKEDIQVLDYKILKPFYGNIKISEKNRPRLNIVMIPIYIEDKLQAIISIFSQRDEYYAEEINLISFTFQGLLIFKMKENYLKDLIYNKECFKDLLNYSVEMHYRQHLPSRKVEYVSSACKEITGFTEEEIKKEPFILFSRIIEEDKKMLGNNFNLNKIKMEKKNKVENYVEYRFIHKDGSIKWFADLFVVLFDMNYRPLYVVGSIRDITRQKEDEENLLKMQRQIAQNQKMEALGRFSNEIVHDFNNIISGLVGNIELSKDNMTKIKNSISFFDTKIEKFKNHHEILEQINIISNNINEIEDILNDQFLIVKKSQEIVEKIKLFSKPKSQESEIVEINSAISELKPLFDYSNNKKIRIEYELSNKKIFIRINRSQFEQIILNLIVNSFDAIDKKEGRILIKTELIKNTNIFALDKNIGKIFAKISIIDNGCGIDEKIISNIFEPYFTTKGKKGTGLGLSIVYSIIKKNNGFIDVNSKLNEGTEFIIHFPLCKEGKTKNENKFSQNF